MLIDAAMDLVEKVAPPPSAGEMEKALEAALGENAGAKLAWRPKEWVEVGAETAQQLLKMIDALEDLDDVQNVYGNYDVPEDVLASL